MFQGQVTADIRLVGKMEEVAGLEGSAEREMFNERFKREMAKLMGISPERLHIEAITAD